MRLPCKVEIFLFNFDEAKEKMGTDGGGFASLKKFKRQIYFAFRNEPILNTRTNTYEYVGIHEMVHIITINKLCGFKTSFFLEGYSNAVDGNYGSRMQGNQLTWYSIDSSLVKIIEHGKLLTPSELLYNDNIPPRGYYPQVGCLIDWLFETYGVEQVNKLYCLKRNKIEKEFFKVTGVSFDEMEKRYMEYRLKS